MSKVSDSVSDDIWDAVENAVMQGTSVADFLNEVRSSWQEAIRRQGQAAEYEFSVRLK